MWETVLFYSAAKPESRSSAQRNVLWILAFPLSGSALYLQEPWILPAVAEILSAAIHVTLGQEIQTRNGCLYRM
jgi:hypothetical protein